MGPRIVIYIFAASLWKVICFAFDVLGPGTFLFEHENSMTLIFFTFGKSNLVGACGSAWERVGARGSGHKFKVSNLIQRIFRIFIYTIVNFGWFPNMKKTVEAPEKMVFENERCDHSKGFLWFYVFTTVRKRSILWGKMLAETKLKWRLDPNSPRSNGNVRFLRINQYISEWWVDRRAPTPLPHAPTALPHAPTQPSMHNLSFRNFKIISRMDQCLAEGKFFSVWKDHTLEPR